VSDPPGLKRDVRPDRRADVITGQIVVTGSLVPRRFGGGRKGELAAGRFLDSPKVTPEAILDIHVMRTAAAAQGRRIVAIQDTTEVNFSGRDRSRRGLGPGADGKAKGFFIHATVAVDADSEQLVGVLDAQIWTRPPAGRRKRRQACTVEEKETMRWITAMKQAHLRLLRAATKRIHITDREGDFYPLLARVPEGDDLVIRARHNRKMPAGGRLFDAADAWPDLGVSEIVVPPRGPGMGNADTVQQRGRFFGYKRQYLGFCRIYLEQDALNAFEDYMAHEEDMRRQLQDVQYSGRPLSEWKRRFVLSPDLQACRRNVIEYDYVRGNYADRWFYPAIAEAPTEVLDANRATTAQFLAGLELAVDPDLADREPAQRHRVCRDLSLAQVIENLIVPFRVTGAGDTSHLIGVMLQLSKALEDNGDERCTVYQVSPDFPRSRAIDANGKINELFQGATRLASGGYSYPGDSAFRDDDTVTVQIHTLKLRRDDAVVVENVPVIAIWVPRRLEVDWVAQHQHTQDD